MLSCSLITILKCISSYVSTFFIWILCIASLWHCLSFESVNYFIASIFQNRFIFYFPSPKLLAFSKVVRQSGTSMSWLSVLLLVLRYLKPKLYRNIIHKHLAMWQITACDSKYGNWWSDYTIQHFCGFRDYISWTQAFMDPCLRWSLSSKAKRFWS